MDSFKNSYIYDRQEKYRVKSNGVSGGVYGLALIGALIYYIQQATTFWAVVLGFLKALVWPALLIYNLLEYLKM